MTTAATTTGPFARDALALVEHPDLSTGGEWLSVLPGGAVALHRAVQRTLRLADRRDLYDSILLVELKAAGRATGMRSELHPALTASLYALARAFPDSGLGMLLLCSRLAVGSRDRKPAAVR